MRGLMFLLAVLASLPASAAEKSGAPRLVYKIDGIIAMASHGMIQIQVHGAVLTGGWKEAKLKIVRAPADPHALVVDFVATPPPAGRAVIQGLLPVNANATVALRKGVVTVRAVSSANEMTTQILK